MSEIVPNNGGVSRRQAKRLASDLSATDAQAAREVARIDAIGDTELAKVDNIGIIAKRTLFMVADISQTEQTLASLVPLATTRLQAIADVGSLAGAEILTDAVIRMRRAR